jgi:hypothetical protein
MSYTTNLTITTTGGVEELYNSMMGYKDMSDDLQMWQNEICLNSTWPAARMQCVLEDITKEDNTSQVITMECRGEDVEDWWFAYIQNGKSYWETPIIIRPTFDQTKLKCKQ